MNKIIAFLLLILCFNSIHAQQIVVEANRLNALKNFGIPFNDTTDIPYKIGEIRIRPGDSTLYKFNGRTTGKRWNKIQAIDSIRAVNDSTLRFVLDGENVDVKIRGVAGTPGPNYYTTTQTFDASSEVLTITRNSIGSLPTSLAGTWPKTQRFLDSVAKRTDSARNNAGVLELRKNNIWIPQFTLPAGGSVILDSSRKATEFAIKSSPTDSTRILSADSISKAGAYPVTDRKKAQRNEYLLSYAEMRALTGPSAGVFYHTKINNFYCDFYWDAASTVTDDSVMYIKLASVGTGRMVRSYGNFILADWFGLVGDGATDDSRLAQKAIDFTLSSNSHATWLQFLGKKYAVKNLLIVKDLNHDGQYDFVTIRISGPSRTLDTDLGLGATTIFKTYDGSAFTMGCMLGRNILIENIIGEGAGPNSVDALSTVRWTDTDWLMSGAIRNNEKSPHCFFNIDPFHYTVASPDQYPGLSAYYTNIPGSGTSQITFDGCSARSYAVGLAVSINGGTSNGDNVVWKNGSQYANRSFWAAGQTQSRSNTIDNLYSFGGVQTLVNCNEYGNHQGTPPNLINSNIAGALKYIYQLNGQFSGMTIANTYMESLFSLGVSGGMPITFNNSQILLSRPEVENTFCSPILAEGSTVNFIGGSLEWFDGVGAGGFGFALDQLNFKGTLIRGGVPVLQAYKSGRATFDGVHFVTDGGNYNVWESNHEFEVDESVTIGNMIIPGMHFKTQNGVDFSGKFDYESKDNKIDIIPLETKQINIDTTTHLAYFTTTAPGMYELSDMLITGPIDDATDIYNSAGTTIGFVYAIHTDTIFLKNVPYGAQEGVNYSMTNLRIPRFAGRTIGDVTSGSDTIRNLHYTGTTFNVGMKIKGAGIPANSFVLYVSTSTNKIKISQSATATASNIELYDAKLQMHSVGGYSGVYFKGDEIWTNGTSTTVYKYICTTAGVAGGSPAAVFDTVKYGGGGGGGGGAFYDSILMASTQRLKDTANAIRTTINALPSGGISGLTAGRIPYATTSTSLSDDGELVWDATNHFLGIGSIAPPDAPLTFSGNINGVYAPIHVVNYNPGSNTAAGIQLDGGDGRCQILMTPTNYADPNTQNSMVFYAGTAGDIVFYLTSPSFTIKHNKNVLINSNTDDTKGILQVHGKITAYGTPTGDTSLNVVVVGADSVWKQIDIKPLIKKIVHDSAGGSGATNIGSTQNATTYSLTSSTGTGTTLQIATSSLAGLLDTARTKFIDSLRASGGLKLLNVGTVGITLARADHDSLSIFKIVGEVGGNTISANTDSSRLIKSPVRELGDYYDDFGNATTTETDGYLYDIIPSVQALNDGDKITFMIQGTFVGSATATRTVKVYLGGTQIFTSGGLTNASSSGWALTGWIIRKGSTTARCSVSFSEGGLSTSLGNNYTEVTGLDFTGTIEIKTTMQAGGTGAASNDIIEKMGNFQWKVANIIPL